MSKNQVKLTIWLVLIGLAVVTTYLVTAGLGDLVTYFNTGADPRSALNLLPTAPPDIDERLNWQEDTWTGRLPAVFERDKIAGAYLRAWAQWNISYEIGQPYGLKTYFSGPALDGVTTTVSSTAGAGWQIKQADLTHNLELTFYAGDGLTVAFTDHRVPVVQMLTHPTSGLIQVLETIETYDVVMVLEDGNWQIRFWQRRSNEPTLTPTPPARSGSEFVTVAAGKLSLNGRPYQVAGINYYPRATPWTEFWPNYDPDTTRSDLAIIGSLGLNAITIFLPFDQFEGANANQKHLAYLTDFLDQAEQKNMKVIVTLFDHRTDHSLVNWAADERYLATLIPLYADHPAILAWNLKNEPDRDEALNSAQLNQAWLSHVARQVRTYDPNHLITIGWSSPQAAQNLIGVVDFISYHYYGPAAEYADQVAVLQTVAAGKPVLLQEFGLPTWNTIFPNGHTEAEQAVYYADMLTIQRSAGTAGYMAWTLYDFEVVNLEQFSTPWARGREANLGLIRADHIAKPAAHLVSLHSDLTAVAPLAPWHRFLKPFWLVVLGIGSSLMVIGGISFKKATGWGKRRNDKVKGFEPGPIDYVTGSIHDEEVLAGTTADLTTPGLQKRLQEQNLQLQQEIVERKRVEEEQRKLIGELDSFAHTVAHDLKNPLGALLRLSTSLEAYHSRMSAKEIEEYLHSITQAGQKATNIIEELMLLSGVRKKDVRMEPLAMENIIANVKERLSYMIEDYQPQIILPDNWPVALGYAPWVEEVWANYVSNALKYGGQPPLIELGASVLEDSDNMVYFWILDNGNGLSLEEQSQLFTPFTRLSQTRAEGHGLGLSIVQRIIEKLGGQVGVESDGRPGLGSVFYFTLPASTSEDVSDPGSLSQANSA